MIEYNKLGINALKLECLNKINEKFLQLISLNVNSVGEASL